MVLILTQYNTEEGALMHQPEVDSNFSEIVSCATSSTACAAAPNLNCLCNIRTNAILVQLTGLLIF